jgi:hypothetical protein
MRLGSRFAVLRLLLICPLSVALIGRSFQATTARQSGSSTRLGLDKRRFLERAARQEARIYELEKKNGSSSEQISLSLSERSELQGLKVSSFVEQYDPVSFSADHVDFKDQHNQAFAQLCHYCGCDDDDDDDEQGNNKNIFFLDGQNAGTALTLQSAGLSLDSCYVANRHESTCQALLEWGLPHVAHASAQDALKKSGDFEHVPFGAYYFDGCGGHAPIIIDMLTAALEKPYLAKPPIAVGVSLVGASNIVNKELQVRRRLVQLAKAHGLTVRHVLEDCERYGVDPTISFVEGTTLTTWFLLVEE